VGISTVEIQEALNALILVMVGAGLLLLVLASAGGSIIIRKALHPVTEVITTAKKITADDLSLRIESKERADEIGALVETFNEMIARLERSVKKIKQFSGDVSHELRTPLTIIRGEIEVLLRKERKKEDYIQTLQSVLEEAARMEKIINDLLLLSRLEAMDPAQFKQKVDLVTIASRAIAQRKELATRKALRIITAFSDNGLIKGHPELLERLVLNLLDNAIRYTPKGGKITLGVKEQNKKIEFYIADNGLGIEAKHIPFIFDRFYVADPSRSKETGGVGLGLAIVKWIVDLHGAEIKVESKVDQGTQFTIYFPLD
jgi:heavy metal sensor kinase